jgi:hypothetical protein
MVISMKRIMCFLVLMPVLCGCAGEQMAADDPSLCKRYGLKFGTPAYTKCVADLREARRRSAMADIQHELNQAEETNKPAPQN